MLVKIISIWMMFIDVVTCLSVFTSLSFAQTAVARIQSVLSLLRIDTKVLKIKGLFGNVVYSPDLLHRSEPLRVIYVNQTKIQLWFPGISSTPHTTYYNILYIWCSFSIPSMRDCDKTFTPCYSSLHNVLCIGPHLYLRFFTLPQLFCDNTGIEPN